MNTQLEDPEALLRALEWAHYLERFRNRIFVFAIPPAQALNKLTLELRLLQACRIRTLLITSAERTTLQERLRVANLRGGSFELLVQPRTMNREGQRSAVMQSQLDTLRHQLDRERLPVVLLPNHLPDPSSAVFAAATRWAARLSAVKLFFLTPSTAEIRKYASTSHVLPTERALLSSRVSPESRRILRWTEHALHAGISDVVLVEGRRGQLFAEIFTHDGAGLLFNRASLAHIRRAYIRDVTGIYLLLQPGMASGALRQIGEDQIEAIAHDFMLYEIDGLLVGAACLKPYGDWAELAHFTTLPRYRGKGRARELACQLIGEACRRGFRKIFALSADARMESFFRQLGFTPTSRDVLPASWRASYDMQRSSQAYLRSL